MPTPLLFPFPVLVIAFVAGLVCPTQDSKLLFEDDFERSESQEVTEELGGDWGTNSKTRANGNKQCDLRDGGLHLARHKTADHGVSLVHPAEYRDCRVHIRFRLEDKRDDLGIDFADMRCKEVHAGHICKVIFRATGIELFDFKNGRMKKSYRDAVKANRATEEQKEAVTKWQRNFKAPVSLKEWHSAIVTIQGERMSVELDGKPVGSFRSPGMAHPQKDKIRFSARREVTIDDVKMYSLSGNEGEE